MSARWRKQLWQEIHRVLIEEWDPLAVKENPLAQDEYDSYISGIQRLLTEGCDAVRLSSHLDNLETVSMGLQYPSGRGKSVASKLLALGR